MNDESLLEDLSDFCFQYGGMASDDWMLVAGIKKCRDFAIVQEDSLYYDRITKWVNTVSIHEIEGSSDKFNEHFAKATDEVLDQFTLSDEARYKDIDLYAFLERKTLWGKTGSVFGDDLNTAYINVGSKVVRASRSKWMYAWEHNTKTLFRSILRRGSQKLKVIMKREEAKVRPVVASDIRTYLLMSYFSYKYIDSNLKGTKLSPLWMDKDEEMEWWQHLTDFRTAEVRVPLDQGEFDVHQSNSMIFTVLQGIRARLRFKSKQDELLWDLLMESWKDATVKFGKHKKWLLKNGIMSGWRWTAMLGTMLNLVTTTMVGNVHEERYSYNPIIDKAGQGDDVWMKVTTVKDAEQIVDIFKETGFEINSTKFFIANQRDEFLRKIIKPGLIIGYPARVVRSFIFTNPVNENKGYISRQDMLQSSMSNWKKLADRLQVKLSVFERWFTHDLIKASGLGYKYIKKWLHTDRYYGGYGYGKINNNRTILLSKVDYEGVSFKSIKSLNGLTEVIQKYGEGMARIINKFALQTVIGYQPDMKIQSENYITDIKPLPFRSTVNAKPLPRPHLIKEQDTDALTYYEPDQLYSLFDSKSNAIAERMSRRVATLWYRGRLEPVNTISDNVSEQYSSYITNNVFLRTLGYIYSYTTAKISNLLVDKVKVGVQKWVESRLRLGGIVWKSD